MQKKLFFVCYEIGRVAFAQRQRLWVVKMFERRSSVLNHYAVKLWLAYAKAQICLGWFILIL